MKSCGTFGLKALNCILLKPTTKLLSLHNYVVAPNSKVFEPASSTNLYK